MAADSIKHIAAFSSDGITQALHRLFPDKDKQDVFTAKLTEFAELLEKPAKIAKMDSRNVIPSAKTVFEKCILSQIRTKLTEYEQLEFVGRDVCWKVELNFRTDFNEMDAGELGGRRSYGAQGASYKICVRTPARFLPRSFPQPAFLPRSFLPEPRPP